MICLFEDNNGIIVRGDDKDWLPAGALVLVKRGDTDLYAEVERTPRDEGHRSWGGELRAPYNGAWDFFLRWVPKPAMRAADQTVIIGQATHYCLAQS